MCGRPRKPSRTTERAAGPEGRDGDEEEACEEGATTNNALSMIGCNLMRKLLSTLVCIGGLAACATPPSAPTPPPPSETLRTLTGLVTETDPTQSVRIAGARIEITGGAQVGLSTTSDANGSYQLAGVSGPVDLTITHPDYSARGVSAIRKDAVPVNVQLMPVLRPISVVLRFPGQGNHSTSFAVHNSGLVSVGEIVLDDFEEGDGYHVELYEGNNTLVAKTFVTRNTPNSPTSRPAVSATVGGGYLYTVRFRASGTWPRLRSARFSHPN